MSLRDHTLLELRELLTSGACSATELTETYLAALASDDSNAVIAIHREQALAQAKAADANHAAGQAGPLNGLPIVHKDVFLTQDHISTAGSRMLENFVAPYNATVVERLAAAGAVTLGKANMDEFAMGSSNENSFFGPVANPWSPDRVPGGSSGGSAAAVSGGLAAAATGTDTGGSIRQPASFCGITGLKPTYGRIPRYGMIAFASSLDQAGSMTRDAKDAALMLAVMAGFDARDSTSARRHDPWLDEFLHNPVPAPAAPMTIGLPKEYFAGYTGTEIDALRAEFERAGHKFVEVSLPHTEAAIAAYYVIAGAEASTNLSRFDGVRYGHRCQDPTSLEDLYQRSRSEGFGSEVKRRILTGTYALSVGYYEAYYLKAQQIRRLIANDFSQAFETVDVLLTPTTPGVAFQRDELSQDPVAIYQQDVFTVPISLAGLPAMSIPCGLRDGLPIGAQLIAPSFCEDRILALACEYQGHSDWHRLQPATSHSE